MGKGKNTIDWNTVASQTFPTYDAGTYKVRIDSWEETESKNTKTPQICWIGTIMEGPSTGSKVRDFTPMTEKALFRVANLVKACNVDLSKLTEMEIGSKSFNAVLDACIGNTTYWTLTYDADYQNNKVAEYSLDESQEETEPKLEKIPF